MKCKQKGTLKFKVSGAGRAPTACEESQASCFLSSMHANSIILRCYLDPLEKQVPLLQ